MVSRLTRRASAPEVYSTSEPDRWMQVLDEIGPYDFYHLPAYQRLTESQVGGRSILPVFRSEGYAMAFPILIRDIAIPGVNNHGYMDAACVPGLTGPVMSQRDMPGRVSNNLMHQFQRFLERNQIVSVYSRLHFLLGQETFLAGYGEVREEGVEVAVDLTVPPEELFARYRKNHRGDIKALRSMGLTCHLVGPEYLDEFMRLYYSTMERVGASRHFYCGKTYFTHLLKEMPEYAHLFVCKDGEKVACACIALTCNEHVHSYRIGQSEEYLGVPVTKLVYHEQILWGHMIGGKVFHLGGGARGGRDSLTHFKQGFGGLEHAYSTWRYVADQAMYDDLCRQAFALAGKRPEDSYFPEYRSPSLGLAEEVRR